jgi:hypothetical protein
MTSSNPHVAATSDFSQFQESGPLWDGLTTLTGSHSRSNPILSSAFKPAQNTYLMPTSPAKGHRAANDYRPTIKKAVGNTPACLVNASVTYCGNDQIYAFGGFDQYTDEGKLASLGTRANSYHDQPILIDRPTVYNHVLRLNLNTLRWDLVDNYGDIPGVRMGLLPSSPRS